MRHFPNGVIPRHSNVGSVEAVQMATANRADRRLITPELLRAFPGLYSQEHKYETDPRFDPLVIAKFYHPMTTWEWFALECSFWDAEQGFIDTKGVHSGTPVDLMFFGLVKGDATELGTFNLVATFGHEWERVCGNVPIMRVVDWVPQPLSIVQRDAELRNGGM